MEIYFGWVLVGGQLLWVGGGGWKYILGRWVKVGVGGGLFWVVVVEWEWMEMGGGEWGWSLVLV